MDDIRLSAELDAELMERKEMRKETAILLDLIVAEWESDPTSVQCFDLRIVDRAKAVVVRRRELDKNPRSPFRAFD